MIAETVRSIPAAPVQGRPTVGPPVVTSEGPFPSSAIAPPAAMTSTAMTAVTTTTLQRSGLRKRPLPFGSAARLAQEPSSVFKRQARPRAALGGTGAELFQPGDEVLRPGSSSPGRVQRCSARVVGHPAQVGATGEQVFGGPALRAGARGPERLRNVLGQPPPRGHAASNPAWGW